MRQVSKPLEELEPKFFPPYILAMMMITCLIGFQHSSFVFAQEANMHENKYNNYRIPAGLLITFLEKALLLIHMETHLNDVRCLP